MMQASTVSPNLNSGDFHGLSGEMSDELQAKLRLSDLEEKELHREEEEEEEEKEEEEEEEEFSFFCSNPDGSPISAEEIFKDGQIRPIFPIFDRSLLFSDGGDSADGSDSAAAAAVLRLPLRKLFVEDRRISSAAAAAEKDEELEAAAPGTYCEWNGKKAAPAAVVDASPEMNKKCNSTGFSRLWRFRDLVVRSSSDGKDAFVFLNPNSANAKAEAIDDSVKKPAAVKATPAAAAAVAKKKKRSETASSAHERHYVNNRARKEVNKRRSYLPYRPDLVGFFTSVNGLSRNVHPF